MGNGCDFDRPTTARPSASSGSFRSLCIVDAKNSTHYRNAPSRTTFSSPKRRWSSRASIALSHDGRCKSAFHRTTVLTGRIYPHRTVCGRGRRCRSGDLRGHLVSRSLRHDRYTVRP